MMTLLQITIKHSLFNNHMNLMWDLRARAQKKERKEWNKGGSPSQILSSRWRFTLCLSTRAILLQFETLPLLLIYERACPPQTLKTFSSSLTDVLNLQLRTQRWTQRLVRRQERTGMPLWLLLTFPEIKMQCTNARGPFNINNLQMKANSYHVQQEQILFL